MNKKSDAPTPSNIGQGKEDEDVGTSQSTL